MLVVALGSEEELGTIVIHTEAEGAALVVVAAQREAVRMADLEKIHNQGPDRKHAAACEEHCQKAGHNFGPSPAKMSVGTEGWQESDGSHCWQNADARPRQQNHEVPVTGGVRSQKSRA